MRSSSTYRLVATIWAAVFAIVGGMFLVVPGFVGKLLGFNAGLLGLSGTIDTAGATLWWVLSVSLMTVLTGLATVSARAPADPVPYRLLLASKLVSTAGFLGLAATAGSAWVLAAGADGFVALTLWATHPRGACCGEACQCDGGHP